METGLHFLLSAARSYFVGAVMNTMLLWRSASLYRGVSLSRADVHVAAMLSLQMGLDDD